MTDYVSSGEFLADLSAYLARPPRRAEPLDEVTADFEEPLATEFAAFVRIARTFELPPLLGQRLGPMNSIADAWGFSVEDVMDNEWSVEEDWAEVWVTSRPFLERDACYVAVDGSGIYTLTEDPYDIEWIAEDFGSVLRAAVLLTAAQQGSGDIGEAARALKAAEIETPFERFGEFWTPEFVDAISSASKRKATKKKAPAKKKAVAKKKAPAKAKKKTVAKKKTSSSTAAFTKLVFDDGRSQKFWEATVEGSELIVRFGKVGTAGQTRRTAHEDAASACAELDKRAAQKRKKGYA